jgi:hypothetical protein
MIWLLPVLIFSTIGLFDYFNVTSVYVTHYWRDPQLAWFRRQYCKPNTYNTLCTVPISGNETEWCLVNYNATNCAEIRNSAQLSSSNAMQSLYLLSAAWGVFLILLFILSVDTLEQIISKPLVQQSRKSSLLVWVSLPIFGCVTFGCLFSFSEMSVLNATGQTMLGLVGPMFLGTGGLFFIAGMCGWYISNFAIMSTNDKRKSLCAVVVFITTMILAVISLSVLFAICMVFAAQSSQAITLTNRARGLIACSIDQGGCTRCDQLIDKCPEWTTQEVKVVVLTQAKGGAALAAIFMVYGKYDKRVV